MSKIIRKSLKEAEATRTQTDWEKIDRLSDEQIEQAIRDNPDAVPLLDETWFKNALWMSFNKPISEVEKERISIRLDKDILSYFRSMGKGYQSRINRILRAFMDAQKKAG